MNLPNPFPNPPSQKDETASSVKPINQPTFLSPKNPPKRIGDVLLEEGMVSPQQLEQALSEARATGYPLGAVLVKLGYLNETTLGKALAKLHGLQYIDTSELELDREVMKLLPDEFIKRNLIVPLRIDLTTKRIEVIMARPDNIRVLDEVALITGFRPVPRVTTHREINKLLDQFYIHRASSEDAMAKLDEDLSKNNTIYGETISSELEAEMAADDAPVVQLVNSILIQAIEAGASDVHLEPQKERLLVRFRIDGMLREAMSIPRKMTHAVVSRIKVSSGMDIAERRRPQDGRIKFNIGSQDVDMRVNTLSVQFGEKVVIRILKATATAGGLEKLGLTADEAKRVMKMIKSPNGIILVTGPTGAGKTTSLYACLREINTKDLNITTIEDPIEYPLSGINQTQISTKLGLSFAACLRSILRQDPDVIMVGEIRDTETLEAAIHAALTGHLVFSTIHTNSAAKTIARLLEMGAPSYLLSSSIVGVVAQRLVRRICVKCKTAYTASEDEKQQLGLPNNSPITLYKGEGCDRCEHTGYEGRIGLYEIMNMTREIQELVDSKASSILIQDAAIKSGMMTLAMDGKRKVLSGLTSLAEVTRVLGLDLEG